MKRTQVQVRYRRGQRLVDGTLDGRVVDAGVWWVDTEPRSRHLDTSHGLPYWSPTKSKAISLATAWCRKRARKGERLELTIFNQNGRISKGNGARRTYPRSSDPRRHKG